MPANDSWIYQGRDEKGRFGSGTSPDSGEIGSGAGGNGRGMLPRAQAIIYGAVGHLSPAERQQYSAHLDQGGLSPLTQSLLAWSRAASLDRDTFRERYLGGTGSDDVVDHLRKAAEGLLGATTPEQQRDASGELAAAYRQVGPDRWPRFIAAADRLAAAARAAPATAREAPPGAIKVQELLLTPRFPFLAEPPKGIIPRLMERIPRQSGKEAADRVPSWARGNPRRVGETPNDYAKRLMDERYGEGKWDQSKIGPKSEYNQIKKFGERAFRNPKAASPIDANNAPEA